MTSSTVPAHLRREPLQRTAPIRIVHLGLGAFHRAHQAWYTARASDADAWGIAAFTGRGGAIGEDLAKQDGLYTLIVRGAEGDAFEIVDSIVRIGSGADVTELAEMLATPATAVVTLTITEAGHRLSTAGEVDLQDGLIRADIAVLRTICATVEGNDLPTTALGRILMGLELRRRRGSGPLAIVSCDNLPDNGGVLRRGLMSMAREVSPFLQHWLEANASFVSTSVDRITPRSTARDSLDVLEATGVVDAAPVVTEPFSDWVLSGEFPAGRPAWESAGARFVDAIEPYEARKLWLLNGAHTLLSFAGPLRGHGSVAEAFADPECRTAVEELWDDAERQLPGHLDVRAYRTALAERFANPRIEHRLEQIAQDGQRKLGLRVAPVVLRERASGRAAQGGAGAVGAWLASLNLATSSSAHPASGTSPDATDRGLIAAVERRLADDAAFVQSVLLERDRWAALAR